MRLVIQRVGHAAVSVDGRQVAAIESGAVVLVGVSVDDTAADVAYLARKTSGLRIYDDENGNLNCALPPDGAFLVVSQFTLYGDCRKGNRPSYIRSAAPDDARRRYEAYVSELRALGHKVQTGQFAANMLVDIANDGPVTIIMESSGRIAP